MNFHEVESWEELPPGVVVNLFVESSGDAAFYAIQHEDVQVYWIKSLRMGVRVTPMRRKEDKEEYES